AAACSDDYLTAPNLALEPEGQSELLPITLPDPAPGENRREAPMTLRDHFSALSRTTPGGFGGFYFDGEELVAVLMEPEAAAAARSSLRDDPWVRGQAESRANSGGFNVAGA